MIIIHVCRLSSGVSNGITSVLTNLIPEQASLGNSLIVFNLINNEFKIFENEMHIAGSKDFMNKIKNLSPSVVVFHGGYELKYYWFAYLLHREGISYLVVPHGGTSRYNLSKNRILKIVVNKLFTRHYIQYSHGVIFLNDHERENSIFKNLVSRYAIVPNGVHIRGHSFTRCLNSKIHFIYLSRIDIKYKGLDLLLNAIGILFKTHPEINVDFHFYGSRYDPSMVEEVVSHLNKVKGSVYYHGEVLGNKKEAAYKTANIYILPSLSEGMPITVLEALSYGLPCIVTPQTNMAELIADNHAGWVTTTDVQSIADTLYKAYNEYVANRESYIQNALNAVLPYDWSKIAQKSIQEYSRLIS